MGAVKGGSCGSIIKSQVLAVGELAFTIASGGASGAIKNAATKVKASSDMMKKWKALVSKYKAVRKTNSKLRSAEKKLTAANKLYADGKEIHDGVQLAKDVDEFLDESAPSAADIIRMSAEIAGMVDPFGISGVVAAYSYDKCTRYY